MLITMSIGSPGPVQPAPHRAAQKDVQLIQVGSYCTAILYSLLYILYCIYADGGERSRSNTCNTGFPVALSHAFVYYLSSLSCTLYAYAAHIYTLFTSRSSLYSGYSSSFSGGGACLSHDHGTQFRFVLQSFTLWREIMSNMPKLWLLADYDMTHEQYR